jgi:hypothetical protein
VLVESSSKNKNKQTPKRRKQHASDGKEREREREKKGKDSRIAEMTKAKYNCVLQRYVSRMKEEKIRISKVRHLLIFS